MNQPSLFESTFFVLDFDRCIGNTDKLHEILWSVIENETGTSTGILRETKRQMDEQGYTFDTVEYIAKEMLQHKTTTWQKVRDIFVAVAKLQDVLEPQATALLDMLDNRQIPYGILTYGKEAWQLTKLEAAGLVERGVPFEITHIEHKGEILSGWKRGDEFIIPPALTRDFLPLHVRQIVFLDDKPRSFVGIPEGVSGICVRPIAYPLLPVQQDPLPARVAEARGIYGAIKLLHLT